MDLIQIFAESFMFFITVYFLCIYKREHPLFLWRRATSRPVLVRTDFCGDYMEGAVPEGVLFLTMAVDVQRGSDNDLNNYPRLTIEIVGHGHNDKTWSIFYKTFHGLIGDHTAGAWQKLSAFLLRHDFRWHRTDGLPIAIRMGFVDAGDGVTQDVVFRWCAQFKEIYPCKFFAPFFLSGYEQCGNPEYYRISSNCFKTRIYNNLKIKYKKGKQAMGFCDFPFDRGYEYFKSLTAEEKRKDGNFYHTGRDATALDLRVMNVCAADVLINSGKVKYL